MNDLVNESDIKKIILNIRSRVDLMEKYNKFSKYDMTEALGGVVIEYMVFGQFELEDIAASINEALRGMLKRGADSNGEYPHVGKLVLERQQ